MSMSATHVNSSWIASVAYVPVAAEFRAQVRTAYGTAVSGFLLLKSHTGKVYVWGAPSWCAGLIAAYQATGRSVGVLVNKLKSRLVRIDSASDFDRDRLDKFMRMAVVRDCERRGGE